MSDEPPFRKPSIAEFAEAHRQSRQMRHHRLLGSGGRVAAIDQLHARLADNAALYETFDLQDQRDAVADTLIALQEFLALQGFALCTLAPIMRPVEALGEREHNRLDPMFSQRKGAGRPKASLRDHERTGILAALTEAWLGLHSTDEGKQQAKLARAARAFKGQWFGSITPSQLKTARDTVLQEAPDHPAVQTARIYYGHIAKATEQFGAQHAIEIMMRFLNDSTATFGIGKALIYKTPHISPSEEV